MRCKTHGMNTLQGEIGVPSGWSIGALGVAIGCPGAPKAELRGVGPVPERW